MLRTEPMTHAFDDLIWAVNPLEENELHLHALAFLGAFCRGLGTRIHPAFVLSPAMLRVPSRSFPKFERAFELLARERFEELVRSWDGSAMRPLTVIHAGESQPTEQLIQFARERNMGAMLVSTHARSGLGRLWLGSFAETLLLKAELSVFTVNPTTLVRENMRSVLFPTTFTEPYREAFESVVDLCRCFDATLTLYYLDPFVDAGLVQPEVQPHLREAAVRLAEDARSWREWAEGRGLTTHLQIENGPGYLLPRLVQLAEQKNVDVIAIASGPGSLCSGHLARHVVRHSPCPVWVIPVQIGK